MEREAKKQEADAVDFKRDIEKKKPRPRDFLKSA